MRIAVLICGEPRYSPETVETQKTMILEPLRQAGHTVETILALWDNRLPPGAKPRRDNNHSAEDATIRLPRPNEHALITRALQPVMASFMKKPPIDATSLIPKVHEGTNAFGMLCQHWSWLFGGQFVLMCEEARGKYDTILRLRLDAHFEQPIVLPDPLDGIYVPAWEGHAFRPFDPAKICNDQVAIGPRLLMLPFLRIIKFYASILEGNFLLTPELAVHYYLNHVAKCGFRTFQLRYKLRR